MFTKEFWRATGERAIKTWAQTLASVIAAGAITWGIAEWQEALIASVIAAGLSVLTSLASNGVGAPGPSLGAETASHPVHTSMSSDVEAPQFNPTPVQSPDEGPAEVPQFTQPPAQPVEMPSVESQQFTQSVSDADRTINVVGDKE